MKRLLLFFLFTVSLSLQAQQIVLPGIGSLEGELLGQIAPQAVVPVQGFPEEVGSLELAISERQYPVTPGDIYTLTFLLANEAVSSTLLVESDYTINMTIFGKLNARGMTFAQLKPVIEQIIADAYPRSLPSVTITSVGIFQVSIRGEIPQSRYVTVWGLSRLSEVLEDALGPYSSVRDVRIISENGQEKTYDLLMALNQGNLNQNPRIKPGDTIVINRIQKAVEIRGEVYAPGIYHLLDNEDFKDILTYTRGFTPGANLSRIRVDRFSGDRPITFFLNYNDESALETFEFQNDDVITVPEIARTQPVVFVEGGLSIEEEVTPLFAATPEDTLVDDINRVVYPITEGETLYDVLDSLRDSFDPFVDLENAYLLRNGAIIPVNMLNLIYRADMNEDLVLEPFDRIVIPVDRPVVNVTGAVNMPGRFSFNAQESYLYYIALAGGFDQHRNNNNKVIIFSRDGSRRDAALPLEPGDTIQALSTDFLYNFNQYFPAIATGLGFILTIITISNALNQLGDEE